MRLRLNTKLINAAKNAATLAGAAERAGNLARPLDRLGHHLVRKTQHVIESGQRGIHLRHRNSGLWGSMTHRVGFGSLVVGGNAYSRIHQEGGEIRPRPGHKFLAIPIADNVRADGDPRFASPLLVEDGFFFEGKRGGLFFGRKLEKKTINRRKRARGQAAKSLLKNAANTADYEVLFVLKRQVTMPERRYCTFDPADSGVFKEYVSDWIMRGR